MGLRSPESYFWFVCFDLFAWKILNALIYTSIIILLLALALSPACQVALHANRVAACAGSIRWRGGR
jgi:hypothetical protein